MNDSLGLLLSQGLPLLLFGFPVREVSLQAQCSGLLLHHILQLVFEHFFEFDLLCKDGLHLRYLIAVALFEDLSLLLLLLRIVYHSEPVRLSALQPLELPVERLVIGEQSVDLEAQVEVLRLHQLGGLLGSSLVFFTLAQRIAQLVEL